MITRRYWSPCTFPLRICAALFAIVATAWAVDASLMISPATVRVTLDGARPSGSFVLTNTGEQSERYRATAVFFSITEDGGLQVAPSGEYSLSSWIRFNPAEFELPAKGKRVVRYTILAPRELERGEYWGAIEFEPLRGALSKFADEAGRTFKLEIVSAALVSVFGTKGRIEQAAEIVSAGLERGEGAPVLHLRLRNAGTGRLDLGGSYELYDTNGQPVARGGLPTMMVLRGGARALRIPTAADLPKGNYTLTVRLEAQQLETPTMAEFPITLPD